MVKRKLGDVEAVPVNGNKKANGKTVRSRSDVQVTSEPITLDRDEDEDVEEEAEHSEDEAWTGFGAEEPATKVDVSANEGKSSIPPNREELKAIKEASELFKSNAFKLKIDALLPNVRPKESRIAPLESFLRSLHSFLMELSPTSPEHPLKASKILLKNGVNLQYPVPSPGEDSKWTVVFEKPTSIALVGSWATNVRVKSKDDAGWTVDVAIEMPTTIFQEKDYLDSRFFHKKAFYLGHIASKISSEPSLNVDISFDQSQMDDRLCSLILIPRKDGSKDDFSKLGARIRIFPFISTLGPMALNHLSPSHSNLRFKVRGEDSTQTSPTPIYNNDMLLCSSPRKNLVHLHNMMQNTPAFRDALSLLRIWANQRGYCTSNGNVGCVFSFDNRGYFWSSLLSYLLLGDEALQRKGNKQNSSRKPIGKGLSSYQLFRAALDFLSNHDFSKDSIFTKGATQFAEESYLEQHEAIFVDFMSVNVLSGVPLGSLDLLRYDAKVTLERLNAPALSVDPFSEVFLTDHRNSLARFDVVVRVDLSNAKALKSSVQKIVDFGSSHRHLLFMITSTLRRALSDRVQAVSVVAPTNTVRPLDQAGPSTLPSIIDVGLILNGTHAFRLVEHGPPASDESSEEMKSFRELWGKKSELRQFKDGRIEESVVWDAKTSDEKAHIPFMIVQYILELHFGVDGKRDVKGFQKDFDELIRLPEAMSALYRSRAGQVGFKAAITSLDNIVRELKALDEELPLAILNVNPVSPYLRYTSVFAPVPQPQNLLNVLPLDSTFLPCMEVIIQFERSARWPDDLEAIQKMKLAFYESIGTALMARLSGLQARVVVGRSDRDFKMTEHARLEIITPDGWAFAMWIWNDREATLLNRLLVEQPPALKKVNPDAHGDAVTKSKAKEALRLYNRRFIHAPKHHRAVANLSHRFPAYPGTTRLVKRWLASHWLFGGHVNDEAIELLCASVFLLGTNKTDFEAEQYGPGIPGTKELGFLRVVAFLKDWSWESGLFVPLYEDVVTESVGSDGRSVQVKAGVDSGVWTLKTKEDDGGKIWTDQSPDIISARRIKNLANSTWECLNALGEGKLQPKTLFSHPTGDYDILIKLDSKALTRQHQALNASPPIIRVGSSIKPRVDFDPIKSFVKDLSRIYSGTLRFFYDEFGGSTIGGVWEPKLDSPRPFRVLGGFSSTPCSENDAANVKDPVKLNQKSILAEIARIGDGIVKSVVVQNKS